VDMMRRQRDGGALYGWHLSGNFFQNYFENKFRVYTSPGIPIVFYDNVQTARISGLEGKAGVYLLDKKVEVSTGLSRYFISDPAAFPFKSDAKRTLRLTVNHAGYALDLLWFTESEQTGWLREPDGTFVEAVLPEFTNLDIHAGKSFTIGEITFFINASIRNLLNDDNVVLQGLALRDRRYYVTGGIQY